MLSSTALAPSKCRLHSSAIILNDNIYICRIPSMTQLNTHKHLLRRENVHLPFNYIHLLCATFCRTCNTCNTPTQFTTRNLHAPRNTYHAPRATHHVPRTTHKVQARAVRRQPTAKHGTALCLLHRIHSRRKGEGRHGPGTLHCWNLSSVCNHFGVLA